MDNEIEANPNCDQPLILPKDKKVIHSLTSRVFNEIREEEEAEYFYKLKELMDKYTKGFNE